MRGREALVMVGAAAGLFVCAAMLAQPGVAPAAPVAAAATVSRPPTITITAVGDLLFDSAPKRLIQSSGGKAPFAAVASRLNKADVTVGNLECALSNRGTPVPGKAFTFRGDPRAVDGLRWAGFDLLALGNNHARDYGDLALRDTFANLGRARIAYAGAGVNRAAAWRPATITRKGAKIAFLSFSQIGPSTFAATPSRSGTLYTMDTAAVKRAIRSASTRSDYVIVSFHWGVEKEYYPTSRQVRDGRAAIDAGADVVLSHHPHRIQGVEYYKGRLIAYSLANFVFSPGSEGGRDTMILHATLTPKGVVRATAEPIYIGAYGKPVPAKGATADRIIGIIKRTSAARGTRVAVSGTTVRLAPR